MVWNVQLVAPVRASKPRIQPGGRSFVSFSDEIDIGVTTVSPTTMGGDWTE